MTSRPGDNALRAVIYALICELLIFAGIITVIFVLVLTHHPEGP